MRSACRLRSAFRRSRPTRRWPRCSPTGRDVYEANRWIAQSLQKAFTLAQRKTYADLNESHAFKAMLPWLPSHVEEIKRTMGEDWWPYGFAANRHGLDTWYGLSRAQDAFDERGALNGAVAHDAMARAAR